MEAGAQKTEHDPVYEPKIVAFCCNWCSYAGADLAGTTRIQYPRMSGSSGSCAPEGSTQHLC